MSMFKREQLYNSIGLPYTKRVFADHGLNDDNLMYLETNFNKKPLPVLRDLYVAMTVNDPTEVQFVEAIFDGDFSWWFRVSETTWMQAHLKDWRKEADIKRKSKAFETLMAEATGEGRNAMQAARYLIDEPWKGRTPKVVKEKRESTEAAAKGVNVADLKQYMESKGK